MTASTNNNTNSAEQNSQRATLHIGIMGAGIAGLSAAIALLSSGFKVTVFEQSEQLSEIGAGLQLSSNATRILGQWGLLDALKQKGFQPEGIKFLHWQSGNRIAQFPLNHQPAYQSAPYLHIHRADLQTVLLEKVQALDSNCIQLNHKVCAIESDENTATVTFQTGNKAVFDWLLGADGIHSLCKKFVTEIQTDAKAELFTGNIAWRGLIPRSALENPPEGMAHLVMAPKAHLVFYYVNHGDMLNYVAIREKNGFESESWTERGSLQEMLDDFSDWHPDYLKMLEKSDADNCYKWALHDRDALANWSRQRCILLGDAAHPVLPFLAQGAAMAIEDAQVLAACLQQGKNVADTFYHLRAERCTKILQESRNNMRLYHESNAVKRFIRDFGARLFSYLLPEFLNRKLAWIYQYRFK